MKFKTWKEARFDILAYTIIPIVVGGLFGIPHRGWVGIWGFLVENDFWVGSIAIWLGFLGFINLLAEAPTKKARRIKRIVVSIVVTLWIWGAIISGLYQPLQPPLIQQHIDPPHYWWRGAPKS
jgi:hypothetical protein